MYAIMKTKDRWRAEWLFLAQDGTFGPVDCAQQYPHVDSARKAAARAYWGVLTYEDVFLVDLAAMDGEGEIVEEVGPDLRELPDRRFDIKPEQAQ
ncbi:MAG: hypothetical protein DHS20C21_09170 [Gemmatimonadota bacterium]|nr:MAG: hypothetical protein DHS20C21_09170 [Gemmatimonadota bacterium]